MKIRMVFMLILGVVFSWGAYSESTSSPVAGPALENSNVQTHRSALLAFYSERLAESAKQLDRLLEMDAPHRTETLHDFLALRKRVEALKKQPPIDFQLSRDNWSWELIREALGNFISDPTEDFLLEQFLSTDPGVRCRGRLLLGKLKIDHLAFEQAGEIFMAVAQDKDCQCHGYSLVLASEAYEAAGMREKAADQIRGFLKAYPRHPLNLEQRLKLADYYAGEKRWEESLGVLKDVRETLPVLKIKAQAYYAMEKWAESERAYRKIWLNYPGTIGIDGIEERYKALLVRNNRSFPGVSISQLMSRAKKLDNAGLRDRALETYTGLLKRKLPGDVRATCLLFQAKIFHDTRQNQQALDLYTQFMKEFPTHSSIPTVLFRMGTIYNRLDDAAGYARTAEELFQNHSWSRNWTSSLLRRGELYRGEGKLEEAAADFDRVIRHGGKSAVTARWKRAWIAYDQGNYRDAEKRFNKLADTKRGTSWEPQALYWVGRCREKSASGKFQDVYKRIFNKWSWSYSGIMAQGRLKDAATTDKVNFLPEDTYIPPEMTQGMQRAQLLMDAGLYRYAALEWHRVNKKSHQRWCTMREAQCMVKDGDAFGGWRLWMRYYNDAVRAGELTRSEAELAVPLPREILPVIWREAAAENLDPYLICALICRESCFDPAALSDNLAAGYMQLMPNLFEEMLTGSGRPAVVSDRFIPEWNIWAGVRYVSRLLKHYAGNIPKALAAYNAGEKKVDEWQKQCVSEDWDEWIEHIQYQQSRLFVKRILENYHRYKMVYAKKND